MAGPAADIRIPAQANRIFVWHRGAVGDIILAGPALQTVAAHYPAARFTLVGKPNRMSLLVPTLPVEQIWDAQRAIWLDLFQAGGPIDPKLRARLAEFDLALVFTPQRSPEFLNRCRQAGLAPLLWLPSFPVACRMPVSSVQTETLQRNGIQRHPAPFQLAMDASELQKAHLWRRAYQHLQGPLTVLAAGNGHPLKNWPLEHFARLAHLLTEQYQARICWVIGPAETGLPEKLRTIFSDHDLHVWDNLPLSTLAARLSLCQLYIGNDSGVTHLAAALNRPKVIALFGPSDPEIWTPLGDQCSCLTSRKSCSPCTSGPEIRCSVNVCLTDITPDEVLAATKCITSECGMVV